LKSFSPAVSPIGYAIRVISQLDEKRIKINYLSTNMNLGLSPTLSCELNETLKIVYVLHPGSVGEVFINHVDSFIIPQHLSESISL
jgi:hypothetical protein